MKRFIIIRDEPTWLREYYAVEAGNVEEAKDEFDEGHIEYLGFDVKDNVEFVDKQLLSIEETEPGAVPFMQFPAEEPQMANRRRIIGVVDGGVIQDIIGIPTGVEVEVRDFDTDGFNAEDEPDRLKATPEGDEYIKSVYGSGDVKTLGDGWNIGD